MTHIYKAKKYATLKMGVIPVEIQKDLIFHSETDLLNTNPDVDLVYFEEKIDGEWVNLRTLKERRSI